MNLPNLITLTRLIITAGVLGLLCAIDIGRSLDQKWLFQIAFWAFVVAALGDAVDGAIARRLDCVTRFGRVTDPLVDKVLICGVFILFLGDGFWVEGRNITGVAPWMVLVIIARELLVSLLRAKQEASKRAFGANWAGKLKMVLQSVTIGVILFRRGYGLELFDLLIVPLVWATVLATILSAIPYILRALQSGAAPSVAASRTQAAAGASGEAA